MTQITKLAFASALVASSALFAMSAQAQDEPLQQVTLAYSNPAMLLGTNTIYIPHAMGYWEEQGYDVRMVPGRDSTTTVQQLISGNADVVLINTSPIIAANARTNGDVRSLIISSYTSFRVFAPTQGGIEEVEDLRGKTIGVPVVGSGAALYLEDYLRKNDIDPENDVRIVVAGHGAQALEALQSGRVDALLTFYTAAAQYLAQGIELNILYDPEWLEFPDHGMASKQSVADADPDMLVALARGFAMSLVFEQASPECSARIYHTVYGRNSTEEIIQQDIWATETSKEARMASFEKAGGELWGRIDTAGLDRLQDFLLANSMIEEKVDSQDLVIDIEDLFERANDFDHERVRQDALACEGF